MSGTGSSWGALFEELDQQRVFMDMFTQAWVAEYRSAGGTIHCRRGCSGCCSLAVSCTLTEAVVLADSLNGRQIEAVASHAQKLRDRMAGVTDMKESLRLHRREMGGCPLLEDDGACGAYTLRPLSCRALLSTRESGWCVADFAELSTAEKQGYLESLDRTVTAFPLHYVAATRDTAQDLEARGLELMRKTLGFSLYGSLPVLLHLVRGYGLGQASAIDQVRRILRESGYDHPLLLDLRESRLGGGEW